VPIRTYAWLAERDGEACRFTACASRGRRACAAPGPARRASGTGRRSAATACGEIPGARAAPNGPVRRAGRWHSETGTAGPIQFKRMECKEKHRLTEEYCDAFQRRHHRHGAARTATACGAIPDLPGRQARLPVALGADRSREPCVASDWVRAANRYAGRAEAPVRRAGAAGGLVTRAACGGEQRVGAERINSL
jgi:hypothetical protein